MARVYIDKIVKYRNDKRYIFFPFKGYEESMYKGAFRESYYYQYLKMPRGAFAMYLIYVIIYRTTAVIPCYTRRTIHYYINKNDAGHRPFRWYKYRGRYMHGYKYNRYGGNGRFVGEKHLNQFSKILFEWHQKYKDSTFEAMRIHHPLYGTKYRFNWMQGRDQ